MSITNVMSINRALNKALNRALIGLLGMAVLPAIAGVNVWTNFGPEGGSARQIVASSTDTTRVYSVGAGRVFRSDDSGANWALADRGLPDGDYITEIRVAPSNGNVIYAWMRNAAKDFSYLFVSTDGGTRWRRTNSPTNIREVSVSATDPTSVVVITANAGVAGVHISTDSGLNFSNPSVAGLLTTQTPVAAALHGSTLYLYVRTALGGGLVLKRTSATSGFVNTATPMRTYLSPYLSVSPTDANRLYINEYRYECFTGDPCQDGLVTSNAGTGWTLATNLQYTPWISPSNSSLILQAGSGDVTTSNTPTPSFSNLVTGSNRRFYDVSGHPNYPITPTFYASIPGEGLVRSTNNGLSRTRINVGFKAMPVTSLAYIKPATALGSSYLLAGRSNFVDYIDFEGHYSGDGISRFTAPVLALGSWNDSSLTGSPTTVADVASDPTSSGTAGLALAGSEDQAVVWRSTNSGANFTAINLLATGPASVNALIYDLRSCTAPPISGPCLTGPLGVTYLGGRQNLNATPGGNSLAVMKSTNGGVSWTAASNGIPAAPAGFQIKISGFAISPSNSQTLYASSVMEKTGTTTAAYTNGVFRSLNGGTTWSAVNSGLPVIPGLGTVNVTALAIASNGTLYAGTLSGLYTSSNGGSTWTLTSLSGRRIQDIKTVGTRVFVATSGDEAKPGGVFRSRDNSLIFEAISAGLPASGVYSLSIVGNTYNAATLRGVYGYFNDVDDDEDNVNTATEAGAPNTGDGNNDGIADSTQTDVSSFLLETIGDDDDAMERATRGRTNYITADVDNAVLRGAACDQLNNVYGIDTGSLPDDEGFDSSDLGIINLELRDCTATDVIITFDDGNFSDPLNWKWRNYGPLTLGDDTTLRWYTFAGARRLNNRQWLLRLNANQPGVYNTDMERLLLRGGPAFFQERFLTNGFE